MIKSVKLDGNNWCGPTALASIGGITYHEADLIYRKLKKSKRRTVRTNSNLTGRAINVLMRRRGIKRSSAVVWLSTDTGIELTKKNRPRIEDVKQINQISRTFKEEKLVPIAIICGKDHLNSRHIIAYDHRKKRLCDNFSRGKVVALKDHPLKRYFVFILIMVPEEYYG